MEKLNKNTVEFLQTLIKTCSLCGIDAVAIQSDVIRGQSTDSSRGTFLLETETIPKFEFNGMGIGRVKTLGTRINILDSSELIMSFAPKERDNGDIIATKLQLSSNKTKIEFTCSDPLKIKAPKSFKDPVCYSFDIENDTLKIMSKASLAIDSTKITFSSEKDGTITFKTADVGGDMFEHIIAKKYSITDEAPKPHFLFSYEIKFILPLFKAVMDTHGQLTVHISTRGVLKVTVNGFNIYILPEN